MLKIYQNAEYENLTDYMSNALSINIEADHESNLSDFTATNYLFCKIAIENIEEGDILDSINLYLKVEEEDLGCYIYDLFVVYDELSKDDILEKIKDNELIPIKTDLNTYLYEEDDKKYHLIPVEISKENRILDSNFVTLILKSKPSILFSGYIEKFAQNNHQCIISIHNNAINTKASRFQNFQYEGNLEIMVNEFDKSNFYTIDLLSNLNKKVPVNVALVGNSPISNSISYLPNNLKINHQLEVLFDTFFEKKTVEINTNSPLLNEKIVFYLRDVYGNVQRFFRMYDILNAKGEKITSSFEKYFKHEIEGAIKYYNNENGSCLYYLQEDEIIKIYDINDTCTTIDISDVSQPKIKSIIKSTGDGAFYFWNNNLLTSISTSASNTVEKEVNFVYSGMTLTYITYPKIKMRVEISGTTNMQVKYYRFDAGEVLIKTLTLNFVNSVLSRVINNLNNNILMISHSDSQIDTLTYLNGTVVDERYSFIYSDNYFKLSNIYGQFKESIFDKYGRIMNEIDHEGVITSYEYEGSTLNLKYQKKINSFKRYIENNSFELMSNDNLYGWDTELNESSISLDDGLYGKCLKVTKSNSENATKISQKIYIPEGQITYLNGYYKHSNPALNNCLITVNATYYVNGVLYSKAEDYVNFSSTDWKKFSLYLGIPSNAVDIDLTIKITISGTTTCIVCFDDFSFDNLKERQTRINLISNPNFKVNNNENIPSNWVVSSLESGNTISGDNVIDISSDQKKNYLGKKIMLLSGQSFKKRFYQRINVKEFGKYIYSFFYRINAQMEVIPYVRFLRNGIEVDIQRFEVNKILSTWIGVAKVLQTSKYYTEIEIGIEYSGNGGRVCIDNFQLLEITHSNSYFYNDKNQIAAVSDGEETYQIIQHDNKPHAILYKDGTRKYFKYKTNGLLEKEELSNGLFKSYQYLNNYVSKCTEGLGDTSFEHDYNNDQDGYCLNETYDSSTSFYIRDNLKNVTKEIYPNDLVIENTYSNYNELINKQSTVNNTTLSNNITYDNNGNITKMISNAGSKYTFTYDSKNNLTSVKINDILLNSFIYNKSINEVSTKLITHKTCYLSGNSYYFEYDNKFRLVSIMYQSNTIAYYEYDENGNVSKLIDSLNNLTKYYDYDQNNKLIKVTLSNGNKYNYEYNNKSEINRCDYQIDNKSVTYKYIDSNTLNSKSFDKYILKYFLEKEDDVFAGNTDFVGFNGTNKVSSNVSCTLDEDGFNVYKFADSTKYAIIDFNSINQDKVVTFDNRYFNKDEYDKEFEFNKSITLCVKPLTEFKTTSLLKFYRKIDEDESRLLFDIMINENGNIMVFDCLKNEYTVYNSKLKINEWNILTVTCRSVEEDIEGMYDKFYEGYTSIDFIVNGGSLEGHGFGYLFRFSQLHIGVQEDTNNTSFDVAMISIGKNIETNDDYKKVHFDGLSILNGSKQSYKEGIKYERLNFNTSYEMFDFYNSFKSNKGTNPYNSIQNEKYSFIYDVESCSNCLCLFKKDKSKMYGIENLCYELNTINQGLLSIKFKLIGESLEERNIITMKSHQNTVNFKVYIKNKKLCAFSNNVETELSTSEISGEVWHTFTYFISGKNLIIYLDGVKVTTYSLLSIGLIIGCITYIGSDGINTTLNGQVKNLIISNTNVPSSNYGFLANNFKDEKYTFIHLNEYDFLGRINNKKILTNNKKIEHIYTYEQNKFQIKEECILDQYYRYTYDNMGNVIKIEKKTSSTGAYLVIKEYEYDLLGRLTTEKDYEMSKMESYTYSNTGNIVNIAKRNINGSLLHNIAYTHNFNDDRLTALILSTSTIPHVTISYNGFIPSSINMNGTTRTLTFEGSRIKTYGNNTYYYNSEGVRIKKVTENGEMYEYEVEGHKILNEKVILNDGTTFQFRYSYNQQDQLVGYECDGRVYFYIRDMLGNINKIIDEDGVIVVEYKYDAWGKILKETVSSSLYGARYNPFRYKGYYYDKETQLYWVSSRYYSPELCRWISPDSIEYLDPESINGLNLYAYCGNDPVNNVDPSGHFPIAALLIGIGIGALFGGITAGVSSAVDGNTGWALVGDILGGALIGGATGAAFTLGGLAGVGMIGTKAAIIGFGASTVASFGAGVGANVLQSTFRGEAIDWNEAWQDGAYTAVQSAVCFWVGASMSSGGMWKSLNTKAYSSSISLFRSVGQNGLRSFANGSLLYLEMFGKDMMIRTGVKFLYTYLWSHLRNNN